MKVILNALQAANRSGTGRYTTELARRLPGVMGADNVRLLWPEGTPDPEGLDAGAISKLPAKSAFGRVLADQLSVPGVLRETGADLVHYPATIGSLNRSIPSVVTVHDVAFLRSPEWFPRSRAVYLRAAFRRGIAGAKRIIADSQATADDLLQLAGCPVGRMDVVHLGVDARFGHVLGAARDVVRQRYALPERFVLFVGTIEPRKNVERIVKAWDETADATGCGLVLAGRLGWRTQAIESAIGSARNTSRIHRTDFIEDADLPAVYACAEALVWPSLWEGFGLPVAEAMACGVPVLTSNRSSLPEIAGDAALLVDPLDTAAIAQGILRITRDEKLREDLGEAGPTQAKQFSWDTTARLTAESYSRASESP